MKAELNNIETELNAAGETGKFNYNRSKNIRKATMEIIKAGKEMRIVCLDEFKTRQAAAKE